MQEVWQVFQDIVVYLHPRNKCIFQNIVKQFNKVLMYFRATRILRMNQNNVNNVGINNFENNVFVDGE